MDCQWAAPAIWQYFPLNVHSKTYSAELHISCSHGSTGTSHQLWFGSRDTLINKAVFTHAVYTCKRPPNIKNWLTKQSSPTLFTLAGGRQTSRNHFKHSQKIHRPNNCPNNITVSSLVNILLPIFRLFFFFLWLDYLLECSFSVCFSYYLESFCVFWLSLGYFLVSYF